VAAPAARCGPPRAAAEAVWLNASDGTRLDGALVGKGPIAVVFVHEYPGPANGPFCGWWPFAAWLAEHGVRSLLVNLRCFGESECPARVRRADPTDDVRGAIDALRAVGAERIILAGASLGGVVVVKAAAEVRPAVAGLVDLSGELDLGTLLGGDVELDAGAAAPDVTSPALLAVARGDGYTSVGDMRTVYRRLGSSDKRLVVEPAAFGHGWDMLRGTGGRWSPLAYQILAFVRRLSRT
jgi:pimeloyl-ACP methyl ester carboxylesterase